MANRGYIWEATNWPRFTYDAALLAKPTAEVALAQGRLHGRLTHADDATQERAGLEALTTDVVQSSAIEGELLDAASVRSSIARRLGVDIGATAPTDRRVDGVVDMILDATRHHDQPVTAERLFGWHAGLFPTGYSGISRIRVGGWRTDETGPMEVISGPYGRQRIHFEAPPASRVADDMDRFLTWLDAETSEPAVLKAGLAHLWFVTIHPFDDGNGRIARAIGDLALARSERSPRRFYSLSAQVQRDRKNYYAILESTQRGDLDVTTWLLWFLDALHRSVDNADRTIDAALAKARFWRTWDVTRMNPRQREMLNRILDGFNGNLTTRKWAIITETSQASALRDINELIDLGVLRRSDSSGRSTSYELTEAIKPIEK